MAAVIALLRGVNVGGHRKIKMTELREVCETLGFTSVQSYVQSGNLVFKAKQKSDDAVRAKLGKGIEEKFGFTCDIVIRNADEMASVVKRNPFEKHLGVEPSKLLVTFLQSEPTPDLRERALALRKDPEEMVFDGKHLYMYFPDGMGKAKTPLASIDRVLKIPGTGRNWNTVLQLLEMATA